MRSRLLPALLLTLTFSAAACQIIWNYDDFGDRPVTGGSADDAGSDAGSDADSEDAGTANGLACEAGADCQSGNCVLGSGYDDGYDGGADGGDDGGDDGGVDGGADGGADGGMVCCAAPCDRCYRCNPEGDACIPVPSGGTHLDCVGGLACDGDGTCKVQNGSPCPDNGGAVCLSGICTSGTCCAVECPPCKYCKDGSGCANKSIGTKDLRCMSTFKVCDGFGHCT